MKCSDARQLLATATPNEVSHHQRHALGVHLDQCAACLRYQGVIADVDARISAWGDAAPVRGQARTRATLQQYVSTPRFLLQLRRFRRNPPFRLVLSCAAIVSVCFVLLWVRLPPTLPTSIPPLLGRPASTLLAPTTIRVTGDDRVALTCSAPSPGSVVQRTTTLTCVVDATLASSDTGVLSVRLVGGQHNTQRFFADPKHVVRGTSTTPIVASLDPERLQTTFGSGEVSLEAVLRAADGTLLASTRSTSGGYRIP